jgi:hypothetical protein
VDDGGQYCGSCALNRTIPNLSFPQNVLLWRRVEEAKRRLIYDLRRLGLPLISRSGATIAFDILSEEAGPVLTGHLAGLITLNIVEADDVERESRRAAFREPYPPYLVTSDMKLVTSIGSCLSKAPSCRLPST